MSWKKGEPRHIKLMKLAEAWAKEAEEELTYGSDDVEGMVQAFRDALGRRLESSQRAAG
jgi:hypothetical protein